MYKKYKLTLQYIIKNTKWLAKKKIKIKKDHHKILKLESKTKRKKKFPQQKGRIIIKLPLKNLYNQTTTTKNMNKLQKILELNRVPSLKLKAMMFNKNKNKKVQLLQMNNLLNSKQIKSPQELKHMLKIQIRLKITKQFSLSLRKITTINQFHNLSIKFNMSLLK